MTIQPFFLTQPGFLSKPNMLIQPGLATRFTRLTRATSAALTGVYSLIACVLLSTIMGCAGDAQPTTETGDDPLPITIPIEDPIEEPIDDPDPVIVATTIIGDGSEVPTAELVALGEQLFFDLNLSTPQGQSCASCHSPDAGFADPNPDNPSSMGADMQSFGSRNAPTASYAAFIPAPQLVERQPPDGAPAQSVFIGGLFIDGRAESLEAQAQGPFLNPIEMGNPDIATVIDKIKQAAYIDQFNQLFGFEAIDDNDRSYAYVADAIAAFERSDLFSPFKAKFDAVQNGTETYSEQEARGEQLFNGKAQCSTCHSTILDELDSTLAKQLFSEFSYKNIGVPVNPLLPAVIADPEFVDDGLSAISGQPDDRGKFRTPTLRNIANTAPYMHNGVFETLTQVIEFYNTRDSGFNQPPEVPQNVDQGGDIGELNLNDNEMADLVAFLNALSDR